jgi:hypothetical protein
MVITEPGRKPSRSVIATGVEARFFLPKNLTPTEPKDWY